MAIAIDNTDTTSHIAHELAAIAPQLRRSTVQVRSHREGDGGDIWNFNGLIVADNLSNLLWYAEPGDLLPLDFRRLGKLLHALCGCGWWDDR